MLWKVLSAVLGLALLTGAPVRAAEVTLKVHHFLPTKSVTHARFIQPWAERIEVQSQGRIKVEIYPSMQLGGKAPQLYDQVRDGVVDVAWTLPGYTPGRFPISRVFELPFMVSTAEATSQAAQAFSEIWLKEEFADIHPLMFHVHARGSLHLRGLEVTSMSDMAGVKIRGPNKSIGDALAALGATPVFMPVPQVPEALSKGVIAGTVLPYEVTLPLRVHELATSHTEIPGPRGLYTALFLLAMNKPRYQGLPDDLKAVIDANSGLPLAKEIGRVWDEAEAPGKAAAAKRGNSFNVLSAAEVARWKAATAPVTAAWVADMKERGLPGEEMLEAARALVAKYSGE